IDAHRGDLFAIRETGADPAASRARLAGYGLASVEASCQPMATNLAKWPDEVLIFCPVSRTAAPGAVTPPWRVAGRSMPRPRSRRGHAPAARDSPRGRRRGTPAGVTG